MRLVTTALALIGSLVFAHTSGAQEHAGTERRIAAAVRDWQDPRDHARESLVRESVVLRDTRVAQAAMAAAENSRLDLRDRFAALRVLLTFLLNDPRASISFDPRIPADGDLSVPLAGRSPHAHGTVGAQPVTPAFVQILRKRIERLASVDSDSRVRSAARAVLAADPSYPDTR